MSSPQLELLLSRLANVKKTGRHYMTSCPAHGGHDCVSVTEADDGRVLVHCFAGCDTREVLDSVDLRMSDLFADSLNKEKRREYEIQATTKARDHAKLIMDIAATAALESDEDIKALAEAHATFKAAEEKLEALESEPPGEEQEENRFLSRLTYDASAALDELENQQWIIDQIIPADGFGVLFGASGAYKSFLALSIAAYVSSGGKWFGNDVDNPGQVIYIAAEGAAGLQARKRAHEIRHGVSLSNLGILADAPTINSATDCELLIDLCLIAADEKNSPVKLIVVDTLARSFAGEENSAAEMGAFVRACDRIRRYTGASILVVHHAGKDLEKGARGSSSLRAACDFEFKVAATGKKQTKLICSKAKDVEPFDDMEFKLDVVELGRKDAKGRQMVSLVPRLYAQGETEDAEIKTQLAGKAELVNNLITELMIKGGTDFLTRKFLKDEWEHRTSGSMTKDSARVQLSKALAELREKGWITEEMDGLIRRVVPF